MDEKLKNDAKKVMLVQDASSGQLKAVTNVDKDGNIQTVEPTKANLASLLNVNTNDSFIEAFFKKMMEQADNPARSGLSNPINKVFIMTESVFNKLVKMNFPPEELEKYRVDPAAELAARQGQNPKVQQGGGDTTSQSTFQPMDVSKIDRADLERKGIKWEDVEPHLKAMSYGHKSNKMVEMNPEMEPGGMRVPTKGRISLEEQPDGSIKAIPHYHQEKPNLDAPLHGTKLDDEAKANLLATGNAGKVVELELTPDKKEPCYVTLDKMTNGLEVLPVSQIGPIDKIKGIELSEGQKLDFVAGRKVLVEGMTSRSGTKFDGYVQVNASDKKFDFTYDGLDRNRYAQENKEIRQQKKAEGQETKKEVSQSDDKQQVFIPKKLLGVELDEKQIKSLEAGKATHVKAMMKDGQDQPFNAWVKPNYEKGKLDFFKWNPDYAKKQGATVKPAAESKTQVAVNSEGKTNEATKKVDKPLQQGQQKPTESQQKKQDENKQRQNPQKRQSAPKARKSRGVS
ncbi:DUF3945 domain-containing protein [Parabacteroides sp. OttesenSCG-928-J18]|nr:DUF3945 domain-containing protein [Parabacteroides sp. OttesenSCG-928-J18]